MSSLNHQWRWMKRSLVALCCAGVLALAACGPKEVPCFNDSMCNEGTQVCENGRCVPSACINDAVMDCVPLPEQGKPRCRTVRICSGQRWGACKAVPALPEECNGKDDDCDGQIDNIPMDRRPPCSKQAGVCKGLKQKCVAGQWRDCQESDYAQQKGYEPKEASCADGLDNDCSGQADCADAKACQEDKSCRCKDGSNDYPVGSTAHCEKKCLGSRTSVSGVRTCQADLGWSPCEASCPRCETRHGSVTPGAAQACQAQCEDGREQTGRSICQSDGQWGPCKISCEEGCPPPKSLCKEGEKDRCVDTNADPLHCGICNRACSTQQTCVDGKCTCIKGKSCGGVCVDVQTHPKHCGACGIECGPQRSCQQGVCRCPAGWSWCEQAKACVNLQIDARHCGACGSSCGAGFLCHSGQCRCENIAFVAPIMKKCFLGNPGGYDICLEVKHVTGSLWEWKLTSAQPFTEDIHLTLVDHNYPSRKPRVFQRLAIKGKSSYRFYRRGERIDIFYASFGNQKAAQLQLQIIHPHHCAASSIPPSGIPTRSPNCGSLLYSGRVAVVKQCNQSTP